MTTDLETYRSSLLLALRMQDVPGPRIAEALAEVDSHVAETGEDPREAFGSPKEYARELRRTLDPDAVPGLRSWLRSLTWEMFALAGLSLAGGWLLSDGLFALGAGRPQVLVLPSAVAVVLGAVLLAATVALFLHVARREADPVRDPRTGRDMAPSIPRWAVAVNVAAPVLLLATTYVLGVMSR